MDIECIYGIGTVCANQYGFAIINLLVILLFILLFMMGYSLWKLNQKENEIKILKERIE